MSEDPNKGSWWYTKMVGGDFCFLARDLMLPDGDLKPLFPIRHLTRIITNDKGVTFGLDPSEKLGMTVGQTLLRREAILTIAAASDEMIDDMERSWGLKAAILTNKKKLVLPTE